MHQKGLDNSIFTIEAAEVGPTGTASSSRSDLNSTGSQSFLTTSHTNFRFTHPEDGDECVRVPTPSNMVRRWSQNLSKLGRGGRKTIREKTIYRLPSRKIFAVDGQLLSSSDIEIDQLTNEIEQNDYLMQDNPAGKQIRMETIRALPYPLTTKRRVKEKLTDSVSQHPSTERSSKIRQLSIGVLHFSRKTFIKVYSAYKSIDIWYHSMKTIEGHFGSSVGTYFKFLRWLFVLNLILLLFTFSFITIPQILFDNFQESNLRNNTLETGSAFQFVDLLTGEGYLKNSIIFYQHYSNQTFALGTSYSYSLPHAYFMTMLCLYLSAFVIISISMARSYRKSFIETSGGVRSMYAHKIFCSWDFGIANSKAAQLKHTTIFHELKEVLSELEEDQDQVPRLWRFWIFCSQMTAHFLVGGLIAGLGTSMWILMKYFGDDVKNNELSKWSTLYLAVAVNLSLLVFRSFFSWIAKMEDYKSARRALHITLIRNFMLDVMVVGVLVVFWLSKSFKECWETSFGLEIYRLIIIDFLLNVVLIPLTQVFQVFVLINYFPSLGKPTFNISQKSLGLVFNQTLLWTGFFFSPVLPAIMALKMIALFYIKKFTLIYLSKSPTQLWRSAQTQTLYLVFTFLSLLGVIVTLGYIMTQVPVSNCGPIRGYDFMFQIFINGVLKLRENHWIWRCIMTLARPAVIGGILLTMLVIVYYLRSKSKARGAMVKLLKNMLYLEAKDKEYLLMNITKVTQDREWIFEEDEKNDEGRNAATDRYADSCSTWRYERRNRHPETIVQADECILRSRHI